MSTYLRPLKNSELRDVFKSLDRERRGKVTASDLLYVLNGLLGGEYSQEDAEFALGHLVKLGSNSEGVLPSAQPSQGNLELDFTTFVDAVNNMLALKPLESLLKGSFDAVSGGNTAVTTDNMLEFASRMGVRMSEESKLRLSARMGEGTLNFKEFVKCVAEA